MLRRLQPVARVPLFVQTIKRTVSTLKNWKDLEAEEHLKMKCKIRSPFELSDIKMDVQQAGHGPCAVLAAIGLVITPSKLPVNAEHDAKWLKKFLDSSLKTGDTSKGAVPREVFAKMMGHPHIDLMAVALAINRVERVGGVLPYAPAQQMAKHGSPHLVVFKTGTT